jgi:DNA (cytosine-5)-methyltransferase 1
MANRFVFADLFAGAGLFSAGLMQAGFKPILAVECDRNAAATYQNNIGDCVRHGSVTDATNVPRIDVLIAGPPCQGFSTLGRCDPADLRNELSLAILPWVKRGDPLIVAIENVPPFLRSPQWQRLRRALTRLGYCVSAWELEATDFGTPQRRRRAFTIASKFGQVACPSKSRSAKVVTAGEALFDKRRPLRKSDPMHVWPLPSEMAAKRIAVVPPRGDKRDIARIAPGLCPPSWSEIGCQATDVWGRIDPDEPANTIRCTFQNPSKGRYLHPIEDRVLSLREGARLQGVPDSWQFIGLPYPVARQIGNGVPVPLAWAVGRTLRNHLAENL